MLFVALFVLVVVIRQVLFLGNTRVPTGLSFNAVLLGQRRVCNKGEGYEKAQGNCSHDRCGFAKMK